MANFEYVARNVEGKEVAGTMQADSELAVVRTLDERKLFPVRVLEQAATRTRGGTKAKPRDVGVLYGQLSDLLRAGVPLLRALETLQRAGLRSYLASIVNKIRDDVSSGKTLADSMAAHPLVFPHLHSAMVRAGEQAGFLEDVLTNLSGFIERQDELRSKVRGALIYPMLLTVIGSLLMLGMLVILVPQFKPFFENIDKPAPTAFLFALSDLLVKKLYLLVGAVVLAVVGVRTYVRSTSGQRLWDRWRMKIPLAGRAMRMVSITRFCRILGTMLTNGVPILQALAISKDATGSTMLGEAVATAAESVKAGETLATPLKTSGLFPMEIVEMIAVAEESNQLEKVLLQIADTVERRTNRAVDAAVRLIEPIILVIMAAAIGFVAVGLLYPIFTMSQTIGGR